jgi:DNA-directed RNA polymerase specialized sigma24 family protein
MQNTTQIIITASDLDSARRVALAAGAGEQNADDLVNDAVVAVLGGSFDPSKGSIKNYLCKTVKNLTLNHKKRACNRFGHDSVCMTAQGDWETSAGDREEGIQLAAPEGRSPEVAEQIAALEALEADERAFVEALALGHTATEAAALVGWSNAKATRKRREIAARIGR